ncbi:M20 metallopeptidase family protein [Brucella intermedia]|uniref:M20 metallopeptidase family protein n=1 Tax=Brucella intermedia TaxID=94625 RepID=UPI00224AF57E|nr:M20 family metallopeptidase [Brucella intermedia]
MTQAQASSGDFKEDIAAAIERIEPRLVALRREIHADPELAFEEHHTAARIVEALSELGLSARTGIGSTGVTVDIGEAGNRPRVLIRADMDALPIHEETGLPYASRTPGKMHACGHDLHCAIAVGVAAVLSNLKTDAAFRVIFQPAEEVLLGARAMMKDGVLDGVGPVLGYHIRPDLPAGRIGIARGATTAAIDRFEIALRGVGGHTGRPYQARSPILAGADLVAGVSAIPATELDPATPCVIAIGAFLAGESPNVIPDTAIIRGTVRSRSASHHEAAIAAIRRLCAATETLHRLECRFELETGVPAQVNDDAFQTPIREAVLRQLGDVITDIPGGMGGEDFACLAEGHQSFRLGIGAGAAGRHDRLHTATVQPDECAIASGVAAMTAAALAVIALPETPEKTPRGDA